MAIITISRGSYSKGREVAEKAAARLGYRLTSRDVLLEAAERFSIPEIKLVRAIHDAPSILNRFTHGRQCFLAYIRSALADQPQQDNLVYHGLAGHLLLKGVPHVLKVRVIADLEARVKAEMARENISADEARDLLLADDAERRKWTQHLYGVDPWDPALYDLVVHIHKMTVDDAVELIVQAADRPCFATSPQAQRKMDDLALACRVKAALVNNQCFDVGVSADFGNVIVYTTKADRRHHHLDQQVEAARQSIGGINHLEVHEQTTFPDHAV